MVRDGIGDTRWDDRMWWDDVKWVRMWRGGMNGYDMRWYYTKI